MTPDYRLGQLSILLKQAIESSIFDLPWSGVKDAVDVFFSLSKEKQEDLIHQLAYKIEGMNQTLYEMLELATDFEEDEQEQSQGDHGCDLKSLLSLQREYNKRMMIEMNKEYKDNTEIVEFLRILYSFEECDALGVSSLFS
jgi:hypothetical protein